MRSDRHFGGSFLKLGIQRKKARRYNLWTPRVRMPHQILSTLSPLNSLETSATLGQNNPVKRSSMESNRATMATKSVQVDVCIRWRVESYTKEEKRGEKHGREGRRLWQVVSFSRGIESVELLNSSWLKKHLTAPHTRIRLCRQSGSFEREKNGV